MRSTFLQLKITLLAGIMILPALSYSVEDELAVYLANQCSISSGNPAVYYARYGSKLSATIQALTAAQRSRIFGFEEHTATNPAGNTNASGGETTSQTQTEISLLDQLLNSFGG
jgi:hypothetical protein